MPTSFNFNLTQLQVIQAMQARADCVSEELEPDPNSPPSPTEIQDGRLEDFRKWKIIDHLQCKLVADAFDHKIPVWAIPDARATWLARRNRLGRG